MKKEAVLSEKTLALKTHPELKIYGYGFLTTLQSLMVAKAITDLDLPKLIIKSLCIAGENKNRELLYSICDDDDCRYLTYREIYEKYMVKSEKAFFVAVCYEEEYGPEPIGFICG